MQINWIRLYTTISENINIRKLERKFGNNTGLGIYVRLIVNLAKKDGHTMLEDDIPIYAELCKVDENTMTDFISECLELGLLKATDQGISSDRLFEVCQEFENRSHINSENARIGWEKRRQQLAAKTTPTQEVTHHDQPVPNDQTPGNTQSLIPETLPTAQKEPKRKTKPGKDYKKIWERTLAHWNTKNRIPKSSTLPAWEKKIRIALDKFDESQIMTAIDNYAKATETAGTYYFDHHDLWNYYDFMTHQSKGLMAWVDKKVSAPVTTGMNHNENRTRKPRFGG